MKERVTMRIALWTTVSVGPLACGSGLFFPGPDIQSLAERSSGSVGCPPGAIAITDVRDQSWTATCRTRAFYCSQASTESQPSCAAARP